MANYFIVNTGSASKKYALYINDARVFSAHFEKEEGGIIVNFSSKVKQEKKTLSEKDYKNATAMTVAEAIAHGIIKDKSEINGIGLRVVAPGSYFTSNRMVNAEYRQKLEETKEWAPLHTISIISEIDNLSAALPGVPMAAISDSAYHASMPDHSRYYGIPVDIAKQLDLYRFGYHGISFKSILPKLESLSRVASEKVIVCHLGSGASVMAFNKDKSFDTSMGFSPGGGLVMMTRPGDVDDEIIFEMIEDLGPEKTKEIINKESGIKGICGESEMLKVLKNIESGDKFCQLALDIFIYSIKKYIGSYFAILGGCDLLVFTGAIGYHSSKIRNMVCKDLNILNPSARLRVSKTKILAIKTDEELAIANKIKSLKLQ